MYILNCISILIFDIRKVSSSARRSSLLSTLLPPAFITPYSKATTRNDRSVARSFGRSPRFGCQPAGISERIAPNKNYSASPVAFLIDDGIHKFVNGAFVISRDTRSDDNDNVTSKTAIRCTLRRHYQGRYTVRTLTIFISSFLLAR